VVVAASPDVEAPTDRTGGVHPCGKDQVVVPIRIVSIGRDDVETVAHAVLVMTVRERKIAYVKGYQSKAEALEAVGLAEQDAHADS
jgi:hypothetical protein